MKNLFNAQYEYANPITEDFLEEISQKHYTSGEEKQNGDIPLWGFVATFQNGELGEELTLELFSLCEREFPYYSELYTIIPNPLSGGASMPIFIKKGEENKYELLKNIQLTDD